MYRIPTVVIGIVATFATAYAKADAPKQVSVPVAAPQPDLDKPVTLTLRKLQAIVAAAVAQSEAAKASQAAQSDLQDVLQQATPKAK